MLFEAFKKNRDERPGSPAFLVTVGDRYLPISWKRFTDDIDATAQIVRRFAPGAIIGIMGENSYEWMVVHAAILFTGATVTPVDANLQPVDIAERMRFLKARALLVSTLNEAKGREVAKLCPGLVVTGFASREVDAVMGAIEESLAEDPTQSLWHQ